ALERPGFGLSDFQLGRSIAAWPADVLEAAQHLGCERFAVLGFGAGGPYALACAAMLGEQLIAVAAVSSVGLPGSAPPGRLRSNVEAALTSLLARRAPGLYVRRLARNLTAADRAILSRPAARAVLLKGVREAFRHGSRAVVDDVALMERPWGIDFAALPTTVKLWHGEDDRTVSAAEARTLASAIPGCWATFVPSAGSLWLLENAGDVLGGLFGEYP
ncbi:MAG: alpha/beta hydrolase, partial [Tepidiformaceae bacterium]